MALLDDVQSHLKDAMRARDKARLQALRGIRAAFLEAMKADGRDTLPDDEAEAILRKLAKSRKESIEAYRAGGRDELAEAEEAELAVIDGYLPSLADEDTTRAWAAEAIAQVGASGPSDMGKVMGALMKAHRTEIDGGIAKRVVKDLLTA